MIHGLIDTSGIWKYTLEITQVTTGYFKDIYASKNWADLHGFMNGFPKRVTDEMNCIFTYPFMRDKIHTTTFSINPKKALGVDGIIGLFFQQYWDIVGDDVCSTILNFFENAMMPKDVNHTMITLIPKVKKSSVYEGPMTDWPL